MLFTRLQLTGFKNYTNGTFEFNKRVVGICGLNGKGKTNLLDALNYLCFTRSYFSRSDQLNVNFGSQGFRLEASMQNSDEDLKKITCIYRENAKKEFLLNETPYEKFSHHIGKYPGVFIAPDDIALITGGSEERRKFLDTLISQADEQYLRNLITYNKLLAQRNGVLRYEAQKRRLDDSLLQTIDERLAPLGEFIYKRREDFSKRLFPLIQKFYDLISGSVEHIGLVYDSQLKEKSYEELLKFSLEKDRFTQRTNTGIHKDDIEFRMQSNLFRQIASQGQKKSLLFACKLAEFEILKQEKGFSPVLLLDDVFEKLDEKRVQNLLSYIFEDNDGQVFITDTDAERLKEAVKGFHHELQIIQLD